MTDKALTITQNNQAIDTSFFSPEAREYARQSKAKATQRAYRSLFGTYTAWCLETNCVAVPAEVSTVVNYISHLAKSGSKPATINSSLSAIRNAHELLGLLSPTLHPDVKTVTKGIRRTLGTKQVKKQSLNWTDMQALVDVLPDNLVGQRDKALLLVGYMGAFRRSELVSLLAEDVKITKGRATIDLRRSKTDQEGHGQVKVVNALDNEYLCPVKALREWLEVSGIKAGPIFKAIDQWGHVRDSGLTGQSVALIIKHYCKLAGLNPNGFAGHSLRRGFINAALANRATPTEVRDVTKHQSESAFNEYVESNGEASRRAQKSAAGETI